LWSIKKNGHCNVPSKNGSLGQWVKKQRLWYRSKKLKADRYEKLVGIGFVFEKGEMVGAAKYRKEYEQNIGLIERRMGLTVFDIFVNYSA